MRIAGHRCKGDLCSLFVMYEHVVDHILDPLKHLSRCCSGKIYIIMIKALILSFKSNELLKMM
jgi:hypothetical protein